MLDFSVLCQTEQNSAAFREQWFAVTCWTLHADVHGLRHSVEPILRSLSLKHARRWQEVLMLTATVLLLCINGVGVFYIFQERK